MDKIHFWYFAAILDLQIWNTWIAFQKFQNSVYVHAYIFLKYIILTNICVNFYIHLVHAALLIKGNK